MSDTDLEAQLRLSGHLQNAPEHVVQRALAIFARQPQAAAPGLWPRLLAVLSFDSGRAGPLAFGMRSSAGAVRQLLFSVEGRDVDLRICAADVGPGFKLSGQVLGPDSTGSVVALPDGGGHAWRVDLNELGEFALPQMPAGAYRISLELADMAIDLPLLSVPHPE
jgi:hypothetical protein